MANRILICERDEPVNAGTWQGEGVALWWLGQAGFLVKYLDSLILIDPYLSDVLAEKYKGTVFPHIRMMPPPISSTMSGDIKYHLSTHAHSDHLDPGLVPELATSTACRFVLPRAETMVALSRGVPYERLIGLNAGESILLEENLVISAVPSAHEKLKTNEAGEHHYLGYIIKLGGYTLYHSGDCVPFLGLEDFLRPHMIDLALLPVNGRSEKLQNHGIAGNFTFSEAEQLVASLGIPFFIPHHYDMFEFNTLSPEELDKAMGKSAIKETIYPARLGLRYTLR